MKFKFKVQQMYADTEFDLPSLNSILHHEIISHGMYAVPEIKIYYLEPVYDESKSPT